jgi:hypothetical protein
VGLGRGEGPEYSLGQASSSLVKRFLFSGEGNGEAVGVRVGHAEWVGLTELLVEGRLGVLVGVLDGHGECVGLSELLAEGRLGVLVGVLDGHGECVGVTEASGVVWGELLTLLLADWLIVLLEDWLVLLLAD